LRCRDPASEQDSGRSQALAAKPRQQSETDCGQGKTESKPAAAVCKDNQSSTQPGSERCCLRQRLTA
jgi:hypothetical protein